MAVWQQCLAVDAKFNTYLAPASPSFKTLYLRRRSQLLRASKRSEEEGFSGYLQLRLALLQQRYGVTVDQLSQKSRSTSIRSSSRLTGEGDTVSVNQGMWKSMNSGGHGPDPSPPPGQLVPTYKAEASRAIVGGTSITENYAFSGVHHIFDQHTECVTVVKFANNDAHVMACASLDGSVSICDVGQPPRVLHTLQHHKSGVTGLDWSCSNDMVVSGGKDGDVCLWSASSGKCLRIVHDQANAQVLSCVFHPLNTNWIIIGNSVGLVQVMNVSTGLFPRGGTSRVAAPVTALTFDPSGNMLWCGDAKGTVVSFKFDISSGGLKKAKRFVVSENAAISSLSARTWVSREARDPQLLISCACNLLLLYRVTDDDGSLRLKKKFIVPHVTHPVKSTFSPMMSFRQGTCVVTGSEDCSVWFLDIERDNKPLINKLQGHASPVIAVSFNYDESLLATSDSSGLVIVWRKERVADSHQPNT